MATAKDFVGRVNQIAGVAGCLLIRSDGMVVDQTLDDVEGYSSLLQISSGLAADIMNNTGFSHCRYLNFQRINDQNFYIFPIDQYLLGIVQQTDCSVNEMLEQVFNLIDKVSTNRG